MNIDEARGFAEACKQYGESSRDSFYRGAFCKASEVINILCDCIEGEEERKQERETFPPAPPIKRKGKGKKYPYPDPRARVRDAVVDISRPPTLDELLAFAKSRGYKDEAFCRKWYDRMENELFWRHPKTGRFPSHWIAYFASCYRLRNTIESPQAAKPKRGVSQTANVHSKEVGAW